MSNLNTETVTSVRHWNDTLFSFTTSRDPGFRFKNGHFTMIGLEQDNGRPLLRAYSIASANYEEELEFFSIKVQDGPLTSQLQKIQPGIPVSPVDTEQQSQPSQAPAAQGGAQGTGQ